MTAHITMPELLAAVPHILAAPRDETTIRQLTFRPGYGQREHPDRLILTKAGGIPGERWATAPWAKLPDGSPDPGIQISILPARTYDLICKGGLHPGDPIIADLCTTLANLPTGTRLRAGTATLQVSGIFNDGCVKWKARYGKDAYKWITRPGHPDLRLRGILCSIVEDGEVRLGDTIRVLR